MQINETRAKVDAETDHTLGIYIHIPFCIKKCLYCDFISFEISTDAAHRQYIEALKREISYYGEIYGKKFTVDTIFFGGGTPSLIDANLIADVIECIKTSFSVAIEAEISIECNPKTANRQKLKIYRAAGINRLSIGVQTFEDMELKALGRVHKAADAEETFRLARAVGFQNINLDLMFATPNHTQRIWRETLEKAVALSPEHLSFYSLQLEEGTKFFEMFESGQLDMVSDVADREMYHYAVQYLTGNGYEHYEISNAAKKGFACKHNLKYWSMQDYLGLGLGSHSFMNGVRFGNTDNLELYIQKEAPNFVAHNHRNSQFDQMADFLITGLRKTEGISLYEFKKRFGKPLFEAYPEQKAMIESHVTAGRMVCDEAQMRFTINGFDISNSVLAEFV